MVVTVDRKNVMTKKEKRKHILVGGPLLGKPWSCSMVDDQDKQQQQKQHGNNNKKIFAPLITSEISLGKSSNSSSERFILLPQTHYITVLAYQTGERLGALVLSQEEEEENNVGIESVVLANHHGRSLSSFVMQQAFKIATAKDGTNRNTSNADIVDDHHDDGHVVLVACSNGTIQEFFLSDLLLQKSSSSSSSSLLFVEDTTLLYGHVGPHQIIPGPCYKPRRIFQLVPPATNRTQDQQQQEEVKKVMYNIQYLSIPNNKQQKHQQQPGGTRGGDLVGYALVETTRTTTTRVVNEVHDSNHCDKGDKAESTGSSFTTTTLHLVRLCLPSPNTTDSNNSSRTEMMSSKSTKQRDKDKQAAAIINVSVQIVDTINIKHNDKNKNNMPLTLLSIVAHHSHHHHHGEGGVTASKPKKLNYTVLIVLAQPHAMTVYLDNSNTNNDGSSSLHTNKYTCAVFDAWPRSNPLCTLVLSPNGQDVALGLSIGEIFVLDHFLPRFADYLVALQAYEMKTASRSSAAAATKKPSSSSSSSSKQIDPGAPQHPGKDIIWRKLHWHAHGVSTLSYESLLDDDNDYLGNNTNHEPRMLYSGGIESCLVTWQLAGGGSSRPSEILPRVAMGGIVHIATSYTSSGGRILVYCSDNTLTLYEAHNNDILWRVQGLATTTTKTTTVGAFTDGQHVEGKGQLKMSPDYYGNNINKTSRHVVVSGLPQAPGLIQWFDPTRQRVVKSLEVVSYNRVSRAEVDDVPVPVSSVIRTAWSDSGKDLMTIHVTPTTNDCMGACQKIHGGKLKVGLVTVLRFWSASVSTTTNDNPYEASAAMSYPHGRQNQVSAIALAHNGTFACTVSNDDCAFRLWRKTETKEDIGGESPSPSSSSYAWTCQYKVGIPAGYSNFKTGNHAVAFSSDDSILAIAFGNMITLWNHGEANLISSLRHLDDNNHESVVESLQFLPPSSKFVDSLLSRSSRGITLQSPYGAQGPTNHGWCWEIPSNAKNITVSAAEYLWSTTTDDEIVAVAIHDKNKDYSHIIWINVETGQAKADKTRCQIQGKVVSITAHSSSNTSRRKSNWIHGSSSSASFMPPLPSSYTGTRVHVLTDQGEVVVLNTHDKDDSIMSEYTATRAAAATSASAPIIDLLAGNRNVHNQDKRKRAAIIVHAPRKKLALDKFGSVVNSSALDVSSETQELPLLYGAFTRAFVGRNLGAV